MFYSILRTPDRAELMYGTYGHQKTCLLQDQTDVSVTFVPSDAGMKIAVTGGHTPVTFLKFRWYGRFRDDTRFLGDATERSYGDLRFEGFRPERLMPWYFTASTGTSHAGYGVRVRPDSFVSWQTDSSGITMWVDLRCGTCGYALEGRTLIAAELVELQGEGDLFAFLCSFCRKMADQPLLPDAPVYGFNNWYYAYGHTSEEQVLGDARLLSDLTQGLENRPYMVLDDGWQKEGDPDKAIWMTEPTVDTLTNARFPDMKKMADTIKSMNVRPGLWYRPLLAPRGKYTGLRHEMFRESLDPSLDETLQIIGRDVDRITGEWGFDLIKYDFSTYDLFHAFYWSGRHYDDGVTDPGLSRSAVQLSSGSWSLQNPMTNAQALKRMYRTIRDHAHNAVIIGCNCVGHLGAGYFHLHRSGDDTSGRDWERNRFAGINTLAFRLCQHKAFYEIDADCVGCTGDTDYTWEQAGPWLELLTDSSTPLFISIPAGMADDAIRAQLREVLRRASRQDGTCEPLNLFNSTTPCRWIINGQEKTYCIDAPMGADVSVI